MSLEQIVHVDGLAQDCSNPIANALELLQSSAKPTMYRPRITFVCCHTLTLLISSDSGAVTSHGRYGD